MKLNINEQRTLHVIFNYPDILRSDLTRRMHGMGIKTADEQQEVFDALQVTYKLIDSKLEPEQLGKRGRRAQMFYAKPKGIHLISKLLSNRK